MVESWATGVAWVLTRQKYSDWRGASLSGKYTYVVADLMDTEAQRANNRGKSAANGDNVSGYTIRQIEDCLPGSTSFTSWRTNIYNKYPNNTTKGNLTTLFNAWYNN